MQCAFKDDNQKLLENCLLKSNFIESWTTVELFSSHRNT